MGGDGRDECSLLITPALKEQAADPLLGCGVLRAINVLRIL